jgi:hypothetical protein
MKKIIIYCILLMLFGFASAVAQTTKSKTTENAQPAKSLEDPKLSPEEQALRLTAGENNPAKIDEAALVDPKINPEDLPTEEDFGASNAKPADEQNVDPKLNAEQTQNEQQAAPAKGTQPVSAGNQPAGDKAGTNPDYRNMPGSGKDQPLGDKPENIQNYREMQGSGQQPAGDIPNK